MEEDIICGPDIPLKIDKDKELGQGGHALVLRGEILSANKVGLSNYCIVGRHCKIFTSANFAIWQTLKLAHIF